MEFEPRRPDNELEPVEMPHYNLDLESIVKTLKKHPKKVQPVFVYDPDQGYRINECSCRASRLDSRPTWSF